MKRLFFCLVVVCACGDSTTGNDAGNVGDSGGGGDATTGDSGGGNDASPSDAATDATSGGDGGTLTQGDVCDPQNNQCAQGLLCCSEPTHIPDASTAFFCEQPNNGQCPLLP